VHESLAIVDEMYLEGLAMKRAQIRRDRPEISDDSVEQLIQDWITNRPMDAPGRVRLT
jgi:Rv0078B-related antitoxin